MKDLNARAVYFVATLTPWLAPFPSAYFVARASMVHLAAPLLVAIVIAAAIECLGVATVHTALDAMDWNDRRHKTNDTRAPLWPLLVVGGVYLVATVGLVVVLEIIPNLDTFALALFPFLAIVGAVNLGYIAQQRKREEDRAQRLETARRSRKQAKSSTNGDRKLPERMTLETFLSAHPDMLSMEAAEIAGIAHVTDRTARNWKARAKEEKGNGK